MVDKELAGAATGLAVLGIIAAGPSYGYDIVRRLNVVAEGVFEWREGTIYPVLHKLERDGLIRGRWQVVERNGRRRKYYHITPRGKAALQRGSGRWSAFNALVVRLSGGLSHG